MSFANFSLLFVQRVKHSHFCVVVLLQLVDFLVLNQRYMGDDPEAPNYDKDKKLISYASEKNILYEYLAESKFIQSLGIRIKKDQIKQCLNETIIFNNAKAFLRLYRTMAPTTFLQSIS